MSEAATAADYAWMAHALRLAGRGLYTTTPNPRVGCVLVRDGQCVGEGWHERAGEPHAEVHALRQAGESARGATAYVTLEPCSHFGRTPPCADGLIAAGVRRVVAAMTDPNPRVAGRGLQRLREAGIEVVEGVLQTQALELNRGFVQRMLHGRPWVRVKLGASLDGRTALANGRSQWITGAQARADVQRWRARSCAVVSGLATVAADQARLTVRDLPLARQPLRVVLDRQLQLAPAAPVLQQPGVLLVHGPVAEVPPALSGREGLELWQAPVAGDSLDLPAILQELGRRGMNEVLIESGARLAGALLREGLVDELLLYQAGLVLGSEARGLFDGLVLEELTQASRWTLYDRRAFGPDWRLTWRRNS